MRLEKSETYLKRLLRALLSNLGLVRELSRGEGYITELENRTGLPKSRVSTGADELIKVGLVEEVKRPGQGKRRVIRLTEKGHQLLASLDRLEAPSLPEPPPNRELVLAHLEAIRPNYAAEVRVQAARSLADLALHREAEVYEEVREVFQSVVQSPRVGDMETPLWQALESALPRMLKKPPLRKWAVESLLPPLLKGAKNSALPSAARAKCLDLLGTLFTEAAESRPKIVVAVKGVWFEDGEATEPHLQMAKAILHQAYRTDEEMRAPLLRCLLAIAGGANESTKKRANDLLSHLLATPNR